MNAEKFLAGLAKFGIRPSLERFRAVLRAAGRPDRRYRVVLVTGTNGKGTCAKALAEILRAHGLRVGLYASPHLFTYTERYEIGGRRITAADFQREVTNQRNFLKGMTVGNRSVHLTEFEFLTLLAYRLFSKRRVDWAVVEIGMGGRWDATNTADPSLSVITSIGIDHTEFLGHTAGRIAFDKSHVARTNCPLLVGPVPPTARRAIERKAASIGARSVFLSDRAVRAAVAGSDLPVLFAPSRALAVEAARRILGSRFRRHAALTGMRRSSLPGRYQFKRFKGRDVLFDVAHNEQALNALFQQIRRDFPAMCLQVLLGMQRQKRGEEAILRHLSARDSVRPVRLAHPRSKPPAMWGPFIRRACRRGIPIFPLSSMGFAFSKAIVSTLRSDLVVVTGSFLTVREALAVCR